MNFGRDALAAAAALFEPFEELGLVADVQCPAGHLPEFLPMLTRTGCPSCSTISVCRM